jgi:predicted component of type VI protein secretion system
MSVLRSIESKLEALFEGMFGRAFRSNVQPVELARKLVKEMDDHRSVSVSRVYVPNEYTVYLAPADRKQFDDYEPQLCDELQDYLAEHARRERYVLLTSPRVKLESDDDLSVGEFGIAVRLVRGPKADGVAPAAAAAAGGTMVYRAPEPGPVALPPVDPRLDDADGDEIDDEVEAVPLAPPPPPVPVQPSAVLTFAGERHELPPRTVVIGRSKDCDIRVADPNVSRRHAEIRSSGDYYTIVDLDSTNGIEVNGRRVKELALVDGTRFTLGSTEVSFSQEEQ